MEDAIEVEAEAAMEDNILSGAKSMVNLAIMPKTAENILTKTSMDGKTLRTTLK